MSETKTATLTIGISSRALFHLEQENEIFEQEGLEAYRAYQKDNEDKILSPGTGFYLVSALLGLNDDLDGDAPAVEVVIMSKNSPDLALRIFKSTEHHGLDIKRAVFSSGQPLNDYFGSFDIDLYLSMSEKDVADAINSGVAAATLYQSPEGFAPIDGEIRIAFDGDAVLFSEESEVIYKQQGLEVFIEHERKNAQVPLPQGPFANFLSKLSVLQSHSVTASKRLSLALITARSNATAERVIRTFREWGVHIDQAFFMAGLSKKKVLESYRPHIFFDDQEVHALPASQSTPTGRVLYHENSKLKK